VCFETTLDRVSKFGTGGFDGTRGYWIPLRGPKRLIVGTDAFMVSAPQALREFVFTGHESSIEFARMPFRLATRDCIVITGQVGGRQVQLAITQDNLPDIWQALAGTGAALMSNEVPAALLTRPSGRPVRTGRYSLQRLAAVLVIVLVADVAAWLGAAVAPAPVLVLGAVADLGFWVAVVMFAVWFYRARVNADGHGWPQRRSPSWAIVAWFVPVVNLWFPFQIMVDIWRAGLPAKARANRAILPGIWWACLLAFLFLQNVPARLADRVWYMDIPIYGTGVLAAIATALLVQKVSNGPLGRVGQFVGLYTCSRSLSP
jgi:hypothetical protein